MDKELYSKMHEVEQKHWWFVGKSEIINSILSEKFDINLKILDVGCGTGSNLKVLSQYGDVIGIDNDDDAILFAQSHNIGTIVKSEIPNNMNIEEKFDLITLFDVLEHIDDEKSTLILLKKMLKVNGKIFITVPAYPVLFSNHDRIHHHKRRYTRKHLKELFGDLDFEIEFMNFFNFYLFPIAFIERLLERIFNIKHKNENLIKIPILNELFKNIFSYEKKNIIRKKRPFGLSIAVIVGEKQYYDKKN